MFKVGDIVRRKPECRDSWWCVHANQGGLEADADLEVLARIGNNVVFQGILGNWSPRYFDLVTAAESSVATNQTATPHNATAIMQQGIDAMIDRAVSRDTPDGERSMACAVNAFNAMFGKDLTEQQGWQFMELLKMSRSKGGNFRLDDYVDGAAYAALAGEAAAKAVQ